MGMFRTIRSVVRFSPSALLSRKRTLSRAANIEDLRVLARRRLPRGIFDYIDGGAEDEITMARNSSAFQNYSFSPRVLRDVSQVDTSTTFLGHALKAPLLFSPTGFTRIAHSDGERAVARVASRHGLPYCLSTLSTRSIEDIARISHGPKWFQVYVWKDRELVKDMLNRAHSHGYDTIMLTVDTAVLGRRERDVRRGFTLPPTLGLNTIVDGILHPAWTWDFVRHEPITFANVSESQRHAGGTAVTLSDFIAEQFDPALSWKEIDWFRQHWNGHIVLKGIQSVEDAEHALTSGVDGIAVSNHGGRQLDGAPAVIDVIAPIAQALQGRLPIICDGGVRRGSDIVKALALGADVCTMGRSYLYGLGAAGEVGVEKALEFLISEMTRTMQLCGATSVSELRTMDIVERKLP